jgi:hypothetical protein
VSLSRHFHRTLTSLFEQVLLEEGRNRSRRELHGMLLHMTNFAMSDCQGGRCMWSRQKTMDLIKQFDRANGRLDAICEGSIDAAVCEIRSLEVELDRAENSAEMRITKKSILVMCGNSLWDKSIFVI